MDCDVCRRLSPLPQQGQHGSGGGKSSEVEVHAGKGNETESMRVNKRHPRGTVRLQGADIKKVEGFKYFKRSAMEDVVKG